MLVDRLAKLASVSAVLRKNHFEKTAIIGALARGLGRAALSTGKAGLAVAKPIANYATKSPGNALNTAVGGLMIAGGAKGAANKYKQYKGGFDPSIGQAMSGQTPTPPGVG